MKSTQTLKWSIPVILVLVCLPYFLSSYLLMVFFLSFLWLVLAANFDILDGFLGYIHLAQGVFFGIGAYAITILLSTPAIQALGLLSTPVSFIASLILCGLFSIGIAFLVFRLKGLYFAVTTLVLVFLLEILVFNLPDLTGGSYGAFVPRQYCQSTFVGYYLALCLAVISIGINFYLCNSKIGLKFISIREDEEAAASIGLDVTNTKRIAYIIASIPSAAAGALFALNSGFIDPPLALGVERSLLPPIMAMLGGSGHFLGPIVGMIIIRAMDVILYSYLSLPISSMFFFGIILMLVALFIPEGLLKSPLLKRFRSVFTKKPDNR